MLDAKLLAILACPACEDRPAVTQEGEEIICTVCGRRYPIRDGIPIMLVESAILPDSPVSAKA